MSNLNPVSQLVGKTVVDFLELAEGFEDPKSRDLFLNDVLLIANSDPMGSPNQIDLGDEAIALAHLLSQSYPQVNPLSITATDLSSYLTELWSLKGRQPIIDAIKTLAPNQAIEGGDLRYLEALLDRAQTDGSLTRILKLVETAISKKEVTYGEETTKIQVRPRTVEDVLVLILTFIQLEDYEKALRSLETEGITLNDVFNIYPFLQYPLETKQKLLDGKVDVALVPKLKLGGHRFAGAAHQKQFDIIYYFSLPDLSALYEPMKSDSPFATTIIHEATHASQYKKPVELQTDNEMECTFTGAFYMALRKTRMANEKDIETMRQNRTKIDDTIIRNYQEMLGSRITDLLRNLIYTKNSYSVAIEATLAFLDYLRNSPGASKTRYEELFLLAKKTLTQTFVITKIGAALGDSGRFLEQQLRPLAQAKGWGLNVDRVPLSYVPRLKLNQGHLLIQPVVDFLAWKDARQILFNENGPIIKEVATNPQNYLIAGTVEGNIEINVLMIYALFALKAIEDGDVSQTEKILQEYMLPLAQFSVGREYFSF